MTNLQKVIAGLTGASLFLSAAPAYALSLDLGSDTAVHTRSENGKTNANVSSDNSAALNYGRSDKTSTTDVHVKSENAAALNYGRIKQEAKEDVKTAEEKAERKVDVTVDLMTKWKARTVSVIKRSIDAFAKYAKRLCHAQNSDETTVRSCINKAKADFKVTIDAAIEASFGA